MPKIEHNLTKAQKRRRRVRLKLSGTADRPRVTVFRSNKYLFIQAIDDVAGKTLASTHTKQQLVKGKKISKMEIAAKSAEKLAGELKKQKIDAVIFDRGQYRYHGRVRQIAETLREQGINL